METLSRWKVGQKPQQGWGVSNLSLGGMTGAIVTSPFDVVKVSLYRFLLGTQLTVDPVTVGPLPAYGFTALYSRSSQEARG